ncbi:autotransporter outer membrane beta-barrel domain-containing protein [Legionella bozemanae]|nr:autotransporter domain-containing protein [Legionella bozemanae]
MDVRSTITKASLASLMLIFSQSLYAKTLKENTNVTQCDKNAVSFFNFLFADGSNGIEAISFAGDASVVVNGSLISGGNGTSGGNGGIGILVDSLTANARVTTNNTTVSGGNGDTTGQGGAGLSIHAEQLMAANLQNSTITGGDGGSSGMGGHGIITGSDQDNTLIIIDSNSKVTGGTGGTNSQGGDAINSNSGQSTTIVLNGNSTVQGGNGGLNGNGGNGVSLSSVSASVLIIGSGSQVAGGDGFGSGVGGIGITGNNLSITNAGTISGGFSNSIQQNAIIFTGGINSLELEAGSIINGNVIAFSSMDTLALGGSSNSNFDVSTIGSQYQNFGIYKKVGTNTWVLTGTTSSITNWDIQSGILSISDDSNLGNAASILILDGGTLLNMNAINSNRMITITGNNGSLVTDADLTLNGSLSGSGNLSKQGNAVLTLMGNSSDFTGTTTVAQGTLIMNGTLGGNVNVLGNSLFRGNGTILGTVTVNNGATIAPNTPTQALNMGGYISNSGAFYNAEINPNGNSSLINVTGTAVLNGGIVQITPEPGTYKVNTQYTLVNAEGGVTGTYDELIQSLNLLFITPALAYDANHVYLDLLRSTTPFSIFAVTPNQVAVANAADTLNPNDEVFTALASLVNTTQAQQAFNSLSGEIYASSLSALLEESRYLRHTTLNRLQQISTEASTQFDFNYGLNHPSPAQNKWEWWVEGFSAKGYLSGNFNTSRVTDSNGGAFIGVDTLIGNNMRVGMLGGYQHSSLDIDALSSQANVNSYSLGVYSGAQVDQFAIRTGAAYTWNNSKVNRQVAFPGFLNQLRTSYNPNTTQVFAELGYSFYLQKLLFEPLIDLAYVSIDSSDWTEHGGDAALTGSGDEDIFYTTLGLRQTALLAKSHSSELSEKVVLGWRHASQNINPVATLAFASGSLPFFIDGAPIAKNALLIDAGLNLVNIDKNITFRVTYLGQLASSVIDNGVAGILTWQFF